MNIIHYSLGLYPHRTGGLNRYVTDLIHEQKRDHKVALLYPHGYKWWKRECNISKPNSQDGVICYRLENALPLPLLYGIKKPSDFNSIKISKKSFETFYDAFHPDVIHIHTLMGLSEEVLQFFKDKGVKLVYTSHDYFGICPKVNLINEDGVLCEGPSPERCYRCNLKSPSRLYLRLRNSSLVFIIRDSIRWIQNLIRF